MNTILAIPLGVRLGVLFLLGLAVGGLLNLAVYTLAWRPRSISPWSGAPDGVPPRRLGDRVPIFGWWSLARESAVHGRGFWIRPSLVDLATGLLFAGLYWWEVHHFALYSFVRGGAPPVMAMLDQDFARVVHLQFASHIILVCVMIAASLIDLDEQTIPDALTIPGTLAGLALAALVPWSLLPADLWLVNGLPAVEFLSLASPAPWPPTLDAPQLLPLSIAVGCWTLWCGGIMPRRWNTRHGWGTAVRVFFRRLLAERLTHLMGLVWLVGVCLIAAVAWQAPQAHWAGLLTALVGAAGGGGMIWIVRVMGAATLGREAMGFGDVMLMSMIGAFIGWQGALIVFFLAPLLGLVNGLVQWIVHRGHEIPYGPYLCLAALFVILKWSAVWDWGYHMFGLGSVLITLLALCFVLMGATLWVYGIARNRWAKD